MNKKVIVIIWVLWLILSEVKKVQIIIEQKNEIELIKDQLKRKWILLK